VRNDVDPDSEEPHSAGSEVAGTLRRLRTNRTISISAVAVIASANATKNARVWLSSKVLPPT
jgi:hypothetical protein